jgi:hypothetical protein
VAMGSGGQACELQEDMAKVVVCLDWRIWGSSDGVTVSSNSLALMEGQIGNG